MTNVEGCRLTDTKNISTANSSSIAWVQQASLAYFRGAVEFNFSHVKTGDHCFTGFGKNNSSVLEPFVN